MKESPLAFGADPLAGRLQPLAVDNRLRLGHLLLWMTATAAVLALFQPTRVVPDIRPAGELADGGAEPVAVFLKPEWSEIALMTALAPALGAGLAGVMLCLWRLTTRRFGFPTQAGHWLLLLMGGCLGICMGMSVLKRLGAFSDRSGDQEMFVVTLFSGVILGIAAWQVRSPLRWRIAFATSAGGLNLLAAVFVVKWSAAEFDEALRLSVALELNIATAMFLVVLATVGGLGMALVSGIVDLIGRPKMDLFHWTGVIAFDVVVGIPCTVCSIAIIQFW